jgi:hypothetical protein
MLSQRNKSAIRKFRPSTNFWDARKRTPFSATIILDEFNASSFSTLGAARLR